MRLPASPFLGKVKVKAEIKVRIRMGHCLFLFVLRCKNTYFLCNDQRFCLFFVIGVKNFVPLCSKNEELLVMEQTTFTRKKYVKPISTVVALETGNLLVGTGEKVDVGGKDTEVASPGSRSWGEVKGNTVDWDDL